MESKSQVQLAYKKKLFNNPRQNNFPFVKAQLN